MQEANTYLYCLDGVALNHKVSVKNCPQQQLNLFDVEPSGEQRCVLSEHTQVLTNEADVVRVFVLAQQRLKDGRAIAPDSHEQLVLAAVKLDQLADNILDLLAVLEFKAVDVLNQAEESLSILGTRPHHLQSHTLQSELGLV